MYFSFYFKWINNSFLTNSTIRWNDVPPLYVFEMRTFTTSLNNEELRFYPVFQKLFLEY